MRFEVERALAEAAGYDEFRPAGSPAERRAVERLAAGWTRAGLQVERLDGPAEGDADLSPLAFGLAAALCGLALELSDRLGFGPPGLYVLAAAFLGPILAALLQRRLRTGRWTRARITSAGARAWRPEDAGASARVVISTDPETPPPPSSLRIRRRWVAFDVLWLLLLWVPCWWYGAAAWLDRAGPALLAGLGMIALLRTLDPWQHEPAPHPADNRTGLALLAELARSWAGSAPGRVEVQFLALGRRDPNDWIRLSRSWSDKPTLVLNLQAPGLGTQVVLGGTDLAVRLAERAARDLWLPHRRAGRPFPFPSALGRQIVGLRLTSRPDADSIESATLAAAAQLVLELTLRWPGRPASNAAAGSPPQPIERPGGGA